MNVARCAGPDGDLPPCERLGSTGYTPPSWKARFQHGWIDVISYWTCLIFQLVISVFRGCSFFSKNHCLVKDLNPMRIWRWSNLHILIYPETFTQRYHNFQNYINHILAAMNQSYLSMFSSLEVFFLNRTLPDLQGCRVVDHDSIAHFQPCTFWQRNYPSFVCMSASLSWISGPFHDL